MLLARVALCCVASAAALQPPLARPTRAARCAAPRAAVSSPPNRFGGTPLRPEDEEVDDSVRPLELQGGWEVRCTRSGLEQTWFELFEDGSLDISRTCLGRGRVWRAEPRGKGWDMIVTVEDKLKSPLSFDGRVRQDEFTGLSYTGSLMAPSKKTGKPIEVGEFRAWKMR